MPSESALLSPFVVLSALALHVRHVFGVCAHVKMVNVATARVVALVQNGVASRYRSMQRFVCHPMNAIVLASGFNVTVPARVNETSELETLRTGDAKAALYKPLVNLPRCNRWFLVALRVVAADIPLRLPSDGALTALSFIGDRRRLTTAALTQHDSILPSERAE
jgi:hypothetical protein